MLLVQGVQQTSLKEVSTEGEGNCSKAFLCITIIGFHSTMDELTGKTVPTEEALR